MSSSKLKLLLKIGLQSFANSIRYGSEARGKWIGQFIGFGTLVFALYWAANASLKYASDKLGDMSGPLALHFISFFMAIGMFMLLKDGMETSMRLLYEGADIPLLASSPLNCATVFAYKLISIVAANLFSTAVWLLPPWVAVARVFHPSWPFYILLLPTLLLFSVILITVISTIIMIIYRFFSSRKVMLILKVVGIIAMLLMGIGLALFFTWGLPRTPEMVKFIAKLRMPVARWYPQIWVGAFLSGFLPGVSGETFRWGMLILTTGISLPLLSILIATRIYYRSWEISRRIEIKRKRTKSKTSSLTFTRGRMRAFMKKELWAFLRNRKQIMMLVMLSVIILVTIVGFRGEKASGSKTSVALVVTTGQIVLYSMMISMHLTWNAFKSEGAAWWLLQSAPISPSMLFHAKLMFGALFALLYTEFWLGISMLLLRPETFACLLTLLVGGIAAITLASINTAVGSLPWMAEVGVAQRNPSARAATIIFSLIIDIFLLMGPIFLLVATWEDNNIPILNIPPYAAKAATVGVVILIFVIFFAMAYFIGKKSLAKLLMMD